MAVVVSLLSDEHHFRTSAKRELGRVWISELNRCDTTSTDSAELLWVRLTHKTQGNKELLLSRRMFSDLFRQKNILKILHDDFLGLFLMPVVRMTWGFDSVLWALWWVELLLVSPSLLCSSTCLTSASLALPRVSLSSPTLPYFPPLVPYTCVSPPLSTFTSSSHQVC